MTRTPLLTSVVGSHAHPGWFAHGIAAAERGEYGPADLAELLDDGVDLAIRDQERAGIDVISDGEMRRAGFFTAEFYRHLTGVRPLPPERRLGAGAHDGLHRFAVDEAIAAPDGLGVVAEYLAARPRTSAPAQGHAARAVHASAAGSPTGRAQVYATRVAAAEAFVPIVAAELRALVDAGATIIQVDEPSPAIHPDAPADFVALFNAAIEPAVGRARLGAHLCFGNFLGRPLGAALVPPDPDGDARLRRRRARARVRQPRDGRGRAPAARSPTPGKDVAAGVIDVKNSHVETAAEVAARIEAILATGVPPERLALVPDCGFSQTARHLADRQARRARGRPRPGPRSPARHRGVIDPSAHPPTLLKEAPSMKAHQVTMLGTGLIGDFYTATLHGQRGRDRVRVVFSKSEERGAAFAERWSIPEHVDRPPRRRSSTPTPTRS